MQAQQASVLTMLSVSSFAAAPTPQLLITGTCRMSAERASVDGHVGASANQWRSGVQGPSKLSDSGLQLRHSDKQMSRPV